MTSSYYLSRKHSNSPLARYVLLEMLDVFSLFVVAEQSVTLTNCSVVLPWTASSPPHCTRPPGTIMWSVDYIFVSQCLRYV